MTPVAIIALIFAILAAIKIIVVIISPKKWLVFVKGIYSSPVLLIIVEIIFGAIVFYFLLQELTVIQIFAAITLGAILTALGFSAYSKETITWGSKILQKDILKKAWLPLIIWTALIVWVLVAIFA